MPSKANLPYSCKEYYRIHVYNITSTILRIQSTTIQDTKGQKSILNIFSEKKTINSVITCMLESAGKDFKIAIIIKFSGAKGKSIYIHK